MDSDPVPVVSGWIGNYVFEVDEDADHAIFVSVFDDRETYHANSSGQQERYKGTRALWYAIPSGTKAPSSSVIGSSGVR